MSHQTFDASNRTFDATRRIWLAIRQAHVGLLAGQREFSHVMAPFVPPREVPPRGGPRTRWDVTQARGKTRDIDFTASEGTWMSADLSPDRTWIVFDLLGHLYRMSVTGGQAEALTQNSGVALNFQPRISPDGRHIAFITDRRGQYNLWIMNADGSSPHAVFSDLNSTWRRRTSRPSRSRRLCTAPSRRWRAASFGWTTAHWR